MGTSISWTLLTKIDGFSISYARFWFWPVGLWSYQVSCPKWQNIILFFSKWGEGIGSRLSHVSSFFFNFGYLQRLTWGKSWTKSQNFGPSRFRNNLNFSKLSKHCFPLLKYYLKWNVDHIWREYKHKKQPQSGPVMDAEMVCKTLNNCNFIAGMAVLMKLTLIMYLPKIF